jgi:hypothetical protein
MERRPWCQRWHRIKIKVEPLHVTHSASLIHSVQVSSHLISLGLTSLLKRGMDGVKWQAWKVATRCGDSCTSGCCWAWAPPGFGSLGCRRASIQPDQALQSLLLAWRYMWGDQHSVELKSRMWYYYIAYLWLVCCSSFITARCIPSATTPDCSC